jgi:hypothetical protein
LKRFFKAYNEGLPSQGCTFPGQEKRKKEKRICKFNRYSLAGREKLGRNWRRKM